MPQRRVKYLGGSHVRRLEAGEDFGGRLATPLPEAVEWNLANNHVAEVDLPDEALDLLLHQRATEPGIGGTEFVDVTDAEVLPTSLGQRRWQAVQDPDNPVDTYEPTEDPRVQRAQHVTRRRVSSPAAAAEQAAPEGEAAPQ